MLRWNSPGLLVVSLGTLCALGLVAAGCPATRGLSDAGPPDAADDMDGGPDAPQPDVPPPDAPDAPPPDVPPPDVPPPDAPIPPGTLRIEPADLVLTLAPGASRTVAYSVFDAAGSDVTASSTLSLDAPALGTFAGSTLTTSTARGGITRVRATLGAAAGDTSLEIDRSSDDLVLPGAPADAATRFGGAPDPTRAPSFVYPDDQTIVPPNLPSFEVHFYPGTGNDLFELSFTGPSAVVRLFSPCTAVGGGCAIALDELTFTEVAIAARPTGAVTVGLRGTATGAGVGAAATRTLRVTSTDVLGGVYYWTAASGEIMRFEFGRSGATRERFIGGGGPFACVGCHALSRDGRRIAVGRFIPGPATTEIDDVATRTALGGTFGANFETFSADSSLLLASDGAHLVLRDGATGAPAPGLAAGLIGSMPDWSADGTSVVYSAPAMVPFFGGSPGHDPPADLRVLAWSAGAFGAPATLLGSAGENNYYPAYSPDGAFVLFNRSAGNSYGALDAHLWVVAGGGGVPVELANANGPGDQSNSWPKWAPFRETYLGEPLMWITFSSKRDYGLRLQQSGTPADMRTVQLWMVAFRPGRLPADPSAPAFWLPFQDLAVGNHIAQWTQQVRRHGCTIDAECPAGEFCGNGMCYGRVL